MAESVDPHSRRPQLKKRFGQHHLRSATACRSSLDYLRIEGESVLEIGGGGGVLTRLLCERAASVTCWEIDPEWAFVLRERLAHRDGSREGERLRVIVGDALEIDWSRVPSHWRVAGNLPYNVGTRIILDFLRWGRVERAAFLVQSEVADRLLAGPGDPAYGGLSVAAAAQAMVTPLGRVSRREFRPPPKVDGTFVGLQRKVPPVPIDQLGAFLSTVKVAFGMRRKTLRNALSAGFSKATVARALERLDTPSRTRAEELDVAGFVRLYEALSASKE